MATDADSPVDELPPTPLRAEQLAEILASESVSEVWIKHERQIFKFWIEYIDRYQAIEFGPDSVGSGSGWNRAVPNEKGEGELGELVEGTLEEGDWRPVSELLSASSINH